MTESSNATNTSNSNNRRLFALAAWIQTFPESDLHIYQGGEDQEDAERLIAALDTSEATSIIAKITEVVCGVNVNAALARSPRQDGLSTVSGNDLIWSTLLSITNSRSRPWTNQSNEDNPLQRKLRVLANLLDCAVQAPDKQLRRSYIGRIMTLQKSTQKTIMAMIEERSTTGHKSSRSTKSNVLKQSPVRSPSVTPMMSNQSRSATNRTHTEHDQKSQSKARSESAQMDGNGTNKNRDLQTTPRPSMLCSSEHTMDCTNAQIHSAAVAQKAFETIQMNLASAQKGFSRVHVRMQQDLRCRDTSTTTPKTDGVTPKIQNTTSTPRSSMKKPDTPSRGHSVAFRYDSTSGYTPDRKRQSLGSFPVPAAPFLSPGTMESPGRLQSTVLTLHQQNEEMEKKIKYSQRQEEELKEKMEKMESDFLQKMMTVEAQSLDRYQQLEHESEEKAFALQTKLAEAQEEAKKNANAAHELKAAKEELEVMNQSKAILSETSEKLRKFREKLTELQDVKEALEKEQDAHGQAVDEIVRLENELQQLQPVKRQVEDYKIRAIEAEVKLVECQDLLRRMEHQCDSHSMENEYLFRDAILQKEQMEELQRRIQEDTQRSMDDPASVVGVGDGISEFNPELKEELVRLRNENLQLRAFQVKRTDDAVQHMEESLDDAKQLADRYKNEYLSTKNALSETKAALTESIKRESDLSDNNMVWQDNYHELEQKCETLKNDLISLEDELTTTKANLEEAETQNKNLRKDIKDWMKSSEENEIKASECLNDLRGTMQELNIAKENLRSAEEMIDKLEGTIDNLESVLEEKSQLYHKSDVELEKSAWELSNTRNKLSEQAQKTATLDNQMKKLHKKHTELQDLLEKERIQRKEDADVAQEALETTRQLLEAKNRKEQEVLQANMNGLLEDERKAYRAKDEEASRLMMALEQEWHEKYSELQERSTSSLKLSRQEAQERIDFIKHEYEEEIEKIRMELSDANDKVIRKGRKMMEEAKLKATAEMQQLDDECRELEDKNRRIEKEKDELDSLLKGKINYLQQQLQFTTSQVDERTREADEYLDQIKTLEREKYKLGEENEQYRRQLGGRYGTEGKFQSQHEKLQREYNAVVEENRNLKKQINSRGDVLLSSISECSESNENEDLIYRRGGGVDHRALAQLRKEYEEQIEELHDEKRDLIMKNASAASDVHKAEKRAWKREEEISRLQAEITSLKLVVQRADLESESVVLNENRSPSSSYSSPSKRNGSPSKFSRSSPGIDRAKKNKAEQEVLLRNRFSSIARLRVSPPLKPPTVSLSLYSMPTDDNDSMSNSESFPGNRLSHSSSNEYVPPKNVPTSPSSMASDVFKLGLSCDNKHTNSNVTQETSQLDEASIMNYTRLNGSVQDGSQQECQQS